MYSFCRSCHRPRCSPSQCSFRFIDIRSKLLYVNVYFPITFRISCIDHELPVFLMSSMSSFVPRFSVASASYLDKASVCFLLVRISSIDHKFPVFFHSWFFYSSSHCGLDLEGSQSHLHYAHLHYVSPVALVSPTSIIYLSSTFLCVASAPKTHHTHYPLFPIPLIFFLSLTLPFRYL